MIKFNIWWQVLTVDQKMAVVIGGLSFITLVSGSLTLHVEW